MKTPKSSAVPTSAQVGRLAALFNSGKHGELEIAVRPLITQHPDSGYFWRVLGGALRAQGKDALDALKRAAALSPDDAVAHLNLGVVLSEAGQFDAATESFRRALKIAPDFPEAHCNLGNTLERLGNSEEAMDAYRCALTWRPDYGHAHHGLGKVLSMMGRLDEAVASFRQALRVKPDDANVHIDLGDALKRLGAFDEAVASYRNVLNFRPECPIALVSMGKASLDQGRFAEARNFFERALSAEPMMADAWAGLAHCRKMTDADNDWLVTAQHIAGQPMSPGTQATLLYAMGKMCDDTGKFDQSFAYCQRANALKHSLSPPYDRQARTHQVSRIMAAHPPGFARHSVPGANPSARPLFIVGMPRSGTSLVEQILASHPDVYGAGELRFWMEKGAHHGDTARADLDPGTVTQLAATCMDTLNRHSSTALRVVDKMPFNFNCLGLIHAIFPNARILHTRRHPIDTCLSIYFQNFSAAQNFAHDLDDLAHYYREYHRLMEHWRAALPPHVFLDLPYEALINDQEGWTRQILEFIGLEWNDRCLSFHTTERRVGTPSNWQARQPIYRTSQGRWQRYREHIAPLLPLLELADKDY